MDHVGAIQDEMSMWKHSNATIPVGEQENRQAEEGVARFGGGRQVNVVFWIGEVSALNSGQRFEEMCAIDT